jgi:hypothetical protein
MTVWIVTTKSGRGFVGVYSSFDKAVEKLAAGYRYNIEKFGETLYLVDPETGATLAGFLIHEREVDA